MDELEGKNPQEIVNEELQGTLGNDADQPLTLDFEEKQLSCNHSCELHCKNFLELQKSRKASPLGGESPRGIHESSPKEERPFVCGFCSKAFKRSYHLKTHIRIHTGEKPFKCSVCDSAFSRQDTLETHKKKHYREGLESANKGLNFTSVKDEIVIKQEMCEDEDNSEDDFRSTDPDSSFGMVQNDKGRKLLDPKSLKEEHTLQSSSNSDESVVNVKIKAEILTDDEACDLDEEELAKDDNQYECEFCPKIFTKLNLLVKHMKTHSNKMAEENLSTRKESYQERIHTTPGKTSPKSHEKIHQNKEDLRFEEEAQQVGILETILRRSTVKKPHVCTYCGKEFQKKDKLVIHTRTHTGEKPVSCDVCHKSFSCLTNLKSHKIVHLKNAGKREDIPDHLICKQCDKIFSSKGTLSHHIQCVHLGIKKHKCTVCDKLFSNKSHLTGHMRVHTKEKPFHCMTCGRDFSQKNSLDNHACALPDNTPFTCQICDKSFKKRDELLSHCMEHRNETENEDVLTSMIYAKLRTNVGRRKPQKKQHLCPVCGKVFTRSTHLKIHIITHTGEKPYKCDLCNKAFSRKDALTTHNRLHTGVKPHKCTICGKEYNTMTLFKNHIASHSGLKPFVCEVCGKGFACSFYLNKHVKIHSEERPHVCGICNKSFVRTDHLTYHMRRHTGEMPYQCTICLKSFTQRSVLNRHVNCHTSDKNVMCKSCETFLDDEDPFSHHLSCSESKDTSGTQTETFSQLKDLNPDDSPSEETFNENSSQNGSHEDNHLEYSDES